MNIKNFKKNNRELLFDKLKKFGYAFHKMNYKSDRCIKINKLLNNGLLGWSHSAELRDGIILNIYLFADKIQLKIGNDVIKEIMNWEDDNEKTFRDIINIYENYFYTKDEVLEYYKDRKDLDDLKNILDSVYPELCVRKINKNKSHFSVVIGSGIATYLVEKYKTDFKKINISSYFLSKNKDMYNISKYNLPIKYRKYLKSYHNYELYNLNLKTIKNIQNKLKNVK